MISAIPLVCTAIAIGLVLFVPWLRARRTEKRALDERPTIDLDDLRTLHLERAPIALPPGQEIEGTFEVPPRATILPRASRSLAGRMRGLHARWAHRRDFVIIQLDASYQSEAVIFDVERNVAWAPPGACDLVFRGDGTEVVEVASVYHQRPTLHEMGPVTMESPLQSEYQWFVRRYGWPSREPISEVGIDFPMGWARDLWLSPDERRACIVYVDQSEGGWSIIELASEDPAHARVTAFQRDTSVLGVPVWSPDGSHLAICGTTFGGWWVPPFATASADAFRAHRARGAAGGVVTAGWVWIHEIGSGRVEQYELELELPPGWGAEVSDDAWPRVGPVRFIDDRTLEVTLPDGSKRLRSIG